MQHSLPNLAHIHTLGQQYRTLQESGLYERNMGFKKKVLWEQGE